MVSALLAKRELCLRQHCGRRYIPKIIGSILNSHFCQAGASAPLGDLEQPSFLDSGPWLILPFPPAQDLGLGDQEEIQFSYTATQQLHSHTAIATQSHLRKHTFIGTQKYFRKLVSHLPQTNDVVVSDNCPAKMKPKFRITCSVSDELASIFLRRLANHGLCVNIVS